MSGHPLYCAILAKHCARLLTNFEYYGFVSNLAQWLAKKQKDTQDTVPCIYSLIISNKTSNFLNNRFIQIDYKNESFDCLDHLSSKYNQFTIIHDPYFEKPPKDLHTSLEAQTLIANSNTFHSKTAFSQEKWIRRKRKKSIFFFLCLFWKVVRFVDMYRRIRN